MRKIELKCRRCGHMDVTGKVNFDDAITMAGTYGVEVSGLTDAMGRKKCVIMGNHLSIFHDCQDGGVGVFEFLGLTPDDTFINLEKEKIANKVLHKMGLSRRAKNNT